MNDRNQGSTATKKKILVFCDFYLPSIKSGGGMWTVVNLVDRFCDRYDFYVVTRNYDSKGDTKPYTTVKTGEWNTVGNARVYYVTNRDLTRTTCANLTNDVNPDAVFLNSALSRPVVKFLMARQKQMVTDMPVIVAPCGELSVGALKGKSLKKRLFIAYAKVIGLFDKVIWKASSELEAAEIATAFGRGLETFVAPDLAPKTILPDFQPESKPKKTPGAVKFIFLSRLVRKKNLKYFLERLKTINTGSVELDIVGPLEDRSYWHECKAVIDDLPSNILVKIVGAVSYADGLKLLCRNHFLVLPTLNENFGYVFIESLAAGSPLLTTNQTSWDEIDEKNLGWQVPLDNENEWNRKIEHCIQMNDDEYRTMSNAARKYALDWLAKPEYDEATETVLMRALNNSAQNVSNG